MDWARNLLEAGSTSIDAIHRLRGLDKKMERLKRKLETLSCRRFDINVELKHAESVQGKRRKTEVENWLKNVQWVEGEILDMEQDVEESGMLSRVQLLNRVDVEMEEVEQLLEQGRFPEGLTLSTEETRECELPARELVGRTFERNLGRIWQCLRDDSVLSIGVYGMGGVGKTTLVTHLHNQLLNDQSLFDHVHWITVSQECSVRKLQREIADCIHLDLRNENDERKRAGRLSQALMRKKDVIILDDVWSYYPLEKIGIPLDSDGCKLILTSRSWNVCRQMECHELIKVETLLEEEAWNLFEKNLKRRVPFPPEVEEIAKAVSGECGGLPLGIIVLSGSMRGIEDARDWNNALEELKESKFNPECMENEVFRVLRFSYRRLKDEAAKQCFLHIALYPEDSEKERMELLQYLSSSGLISGMKSREAELSKGHTILNNLLGASLLQYGITLEDSVKMHDLVRDMVINMTRTRFMVKANLRLTEIPGNEEWTEKLEKVSLMDNQIVEIPADDASPSCTKLTTLLLSRNPLGNIPESFFVHMSALQVLDLSQTCIDRLPSSACDLDKLVALYLRECHNLEYLPPVGKLRSLRTLDVSGSGIKRPPEGLERLISLRFLDFSSSLLEEWRPGILPHLSNLQYLNFYNCQVKIDAEELMKLRKIETLKCHFHEAGELNTYVKHLRDGCLRFYELHLGYGFIRIPNFTPYHAEVRLGSCQVNESILLPKNVRIVNINKVHGLISFSHLSSLPLETFTELKVIDISRCRGMSHLISLPSVASLQGVTPLPSLDGLWLSELADMTCLINFEVEGVTHDPLVTARPPIRNGVFSRLEILKVTSCPKIENLFPHQLLPYLGNLSHIEVTSCERMVEILAATQKDEEEKEENDIDGKRPKVAVTLPKLRFLLLQDLPELRRVCDNGVTLPSIEEIVVRACHRLERIPIHQQPLPSSLRKINITDDDLTWWDSLEWDHPKSKEALKRYLQVDAIYEHTLHLRNKRHYGGNDLNVKSK